MHSSSGVYTINQVNMLTYHISLFHSTWRFMQMELGAIRRTSCLMYYCQKIMIILAIMMLKLKMKLFLWTLPTATLIQLKRHYLLKIGRFGVGAWGQWTANAILQSQSMGLYSECEVISVSLESLKEIHKKDFCKEGCLATDLYCGDTYQECRDRK